jgi:hypothetical protein
MLTLACGDWDMDRSGWEARYQRSKQPHLPTPRATPPNMQPGDDTLWREFWGEALEAAE